MIKDSGDVIVKTLARLLAPFIVAYALYVVMHGHHSPGGGFQGGVILAAGFVLLAISHGLEMMQRKLSERTAEVLSSAGVLIYAGIGFLCIFLGGNFLDYGSLYKIFGVPRAQARSLGILGVELGVALAVMAVMCTIFLAIYKAGEVDRRDGGRQ